MSKPEHIAIDQIYVPVKRRRALDAEAVNRIAESILEVGQEMPILVRPDEDQHRYVLLDGLHRLEACKALGETTIVALVGSAGDLVHAWQSFLLGQGFDPGGLDGTFGDKTVVATKAFQQQQGLTPDGIAGRETIMRAMQLGFELIGKPTPSTGA